MKLPKEIGKEIFSFIIPDEKQLVFHSDTFYTYKFPIAYTKSTILTNQKNSHICLVEHRKRKPRFYLSKRIIEENSCDDCWGDGECCGSSSCCGGVVYSDPYFKSKYCGSDIKKVLLEFILEDML